MQISNPQPARSATVELVALASIIILMVVLMIPVVQPAGDDPIARRMAEKIGQIHSISDLGSGTSTSIEL